MAIDLTNLEELVRNAVRLFWQSRNNASAIQEAKGSYDVGGRAAVTAGKNMNGFVTLVRQLVTRHGLDRRVSYDCDGDTSQQRHVTLPGYYRPTKDWDLLVVHEERLVAAFEFKSQVGSLGNNFNNRCEEAIGTAYDVWEAHRQGAFGNTSRPLLGYLMLLEDSPASRRSIPIRSNHFDVFPEFINASYADRYGLLCRKMMRENLFDAACLILSSPEEGIRGGYSELDKEVGIHRFAAEIASHIAKIAALT